MYFAISENQESSQKTESGFKWHSERQQWFNITEDLHNGGARPALSAGHLVPAAGATFVSIQRPAFSGQVARH